MNYEFVKFGDVVKKINDLHPDRNKWNFSRFVSGRNFNSGAIRLTTSNPIEGNEDIIGYQFKWKFEPGDVLYVVKNPRLRKAAMVNFEGICSISTFVFRTDDSKFLQSLLPFLLQTEDFVSFARKNEHGSTNPFLNWKDIAKYKFYLPPIDEQHRISNLLWTLESNIEKLESLIQKFKIYEKSKMNELLTRGVGHTKFKKVKWMFGNEIEIPASWEVKRFDEIFEFLTTATNSRSDLDDSGDVQYIHYGDIHTKWVSVLDCDVEVIPYIAKTKVEKIPLLKEGDLIIADASEDHEGSGTSILVKNVKNRKIVSGLHTIALRNKNENISSDFKIYLTSIKFVKSQIISYITGISVYALTKNNLKQIKIPLPPIQEQQKITSILSTMDKEIKQLQNHLLTLETMRQSILNEKLISKIEDKIV